MEVSLLARANQLLCDERYDEALAAYGLCVDGDEKCAAAYSGRCFVYLKREKYTAALQDANMALAEDAACEAAFYRKGLACFHLDEFETALDSFQRGLALCGAASSVVEGRKYHMWVRKCEAEIEDDDSASEEDEDEDEADDDDGDAEATMETDEAVAPIAVAPAPEPGLKVVPCTVKYQYYQTSSHLTITLLCKNVTEEEATIEIKPTTLVVNRAAQGCENPNFKGSYLGRYPLVLADFWTSDHLSARSRSMSVVSRTRARGTAKLKRR